MIERDFRQQLVGDWLHRVFDPVLKDPVDPVERARRVLEEAMEFYQSVGGTRLGTDLIADRCFARPKGEPHAELGQVGITVLAAGVALGASVDMLERMELCSILNRNPEYYTERMARKILLHPHVYHSDEQNLARNFLIEKGITCE